MDQSDYRDDMTLSEMAENDAYMQAVAIKDAQAYYFINIQEALNFLHKCTKRTMDHIGVKIRPDSDPRFVDKMLANKKVQVEHRKKYQDDDAWRNGIYIYKDGEMVAFISTVLKRHREGRIKMSIPKQHMEYIIITNARKSKKMYFDMKGKKMK